MCIRGREACSSFAWRCACVKADCDLLILLTSARCRLPHQAAKYFNDNNGVTSVRFLLEQGPSSKAKISRGCSCTQTRARAARACSGRARFSARIHARSKQWHTRALTYARRCHSATRASGRSRRVTTDHASLLPSFPAKLRKNQLE